MTIRRQTGLRPRLDLEMKLERIKMPTWLLFPNTKNVVFSADGDFYACTQSAWASTSKFILFLVEECCGANLGVNQYSGLMKGYVCLEEFRCLVWSKSFCRTIRYRTNAIFRGVCIRRQEYIVLVRCVCCFLLLNLLLVVFLGNVHYF